MSDYLADDRPVDVATFKRLACDPRARLGRRVAAVDEVIDLTHRASSLRGQAAAIHGEVHAVHVARRGARQEQHRQRELARIRKPSSGNRVDRIALDLVVSLEVPREVILDRLTTRRTCSNGSCQEIYNVKSKPPGPGDTCLKCGSKVIQRADETVEAITKRLDTYEKMTSPLIDYYRPSGVFFSVPNLVSQEAFSGIVRKLGK